MTTYPFSGQNVYIVGKGNVGSWLNNILALNFPSSNHIILDSQKKFLKNIPLNRLSNAVFFLAVKDQAIEDVARYITSNLNSKSISLIHFSGSLPSYILGVKSRASFHPAFSIKKNFTLDKNNFFVIEGEAKLVKKLALLGKNLKASTVKLPYKNKPLYHSGCVIAANLTSILWYQAVLIFKNVGFSAEQSKRLAQKLLFSAVKNVSYLDLKNGLTGPIARNDAKTIKRNKEALKQFKPQLSEIYQKIRRLYL